MSLSKKFYRILVEILQDTHELEAGASLLQSDRVIARRFSVAESTARNWRRGTNTQVSPAVSASIISICEQIAPNRVVDLQFIERLSRGVSEIRLAAEALVDELTSEVLGRNSTWHIYSGPLKMFHEQTQVNKLELMSRSSMLVERVLELGIDRTTIPCISELVRYSTHGWFIKGFMAVRIASLSDARIGVMGDAIDTIEKALYIGDGCHNPCLYSGDYVSAQHFTEQALAVLNMADPAEERHVGVSIHDARIMVRALNIATQTYYGTDAQKPLLNQFVKDYESTPADNEWVEGMKQEALGYIALGHDRDFEKAAYRFDQATVAMDRWLAQFGVPFSGNASQSFSGYATLLLQGPNNYVKSQLLEGLIRVADPGFVICQVQARLCQALFYESLGDTLKAQFHRDRAEEIVRKHNLFRWYGALNRLLTPDSVRTR